VLLADESAWAKYLSIRVLATNFDAKLEEFAMDPGSASERVGEAHVADQLTDFERDLRSAYSRARFPSPEQAKPGPMPADDRLRLDDRQGVQNTGCKPMANTRRSKLLKTSRFGAFLCRTLS
jgi:hypothetical protein